MAAVASIVTPETILRWHRELVARKFDGTEQRNPKAVGRPATDTAIVEQVIRMAGDNPTWVYRRIAGGVNALGHTLSHQTVKNILEDHGIDPSPTRKIKTSWSDFIKTHADSLIATDFLTTEVWSAFGLVTCYCLYFIHVGRKVYLEGTTRNPTDAWMKQAARNLTSNGCELVAKSRYSIRDRDTKFTAAFDMIFRSAGVEPKPLPPRSPNLNASAERFVRAIKEECLDQMIFFASHPSSAPLPSTLITTTPSDPIRGKRTFSCSRGIPLTPQPRDGPVTRKERLGGLLKSYHREAA